MQDLLPLLTDDAFKDLTALLALRLVVGEKDIASCESTIVGQFNVALILRNLSEEVDRQCRHDAGPVPVLVSQPQAPRCSMRVSISHASSTI